MQVTHRPRSAIVGIPVVARFDELSTLVPAAWRRLAAVSRTTGQVFAESSTELGDGRYHEVVGVLTDVDRAQEIAHPGSVTVVVPPGKWLSTLHDGPVEQIADTFGALIAEASRLGRTPSGEKLDIGYRLDGEPERHELRIRLSPAGA